MRAVLPILEAFLMISTPFMSGSRKVAAMLSQILVKDQAGSTDLTARELKVLNLVVEGKTNNQIGVALGISGKTVEKYLHVIFQKLGVVSRVEAAIMAIEESLVNRDTPS